MLEVDSSPILTEPIAKISFLVSINSPIFRDGNLFSPFRFLMSIYDVNERGFIGSSFFQSFSAEQVFNTLFNRMFILEWYFSLKRTPFRFRIPSIVAIVEKHYFLR